MDHLTPLSDPLHEPIQVPLLCQDHVCPGSVTLDTYPLTRGCQDNVALITQMSDPSTIDSEAVAQQWPILYSSQMSSLQSGSSSKLKSSRGKLGTVGLSQLRNCQNISSRGLFGPELNQRVRGSWLVSIQDIFLRKLHCNFNGYQVETSLCPPSPYQLLFSARQLERLGLPSTRMFVLRHGHATTFRGYGCSTRAGVPTEFLCCIIPSTPLVYTLRALLRTSASHIGPTNLAQNIIVRSITSIATHTGHNMWHPVVPARR